MNSLLNETLEIFGAYIDQLKPLSVKTGTELAHHGESKNMTKLTEGLMLIKESIDGIKQSLNHNISDNASKTCDELEPELASILKELVYAIESKDALFQAKILRDQLPPHLDRWKNEALPGFQASPSPK